MSPADQKSQYVKRFAVILDKAKSIDVSLIVSAG